MSKRTVRWLQLLIFATTFLAIYGMWRISVWWSNNSTAIDPQIRTLRCEELISIPVAYIGESVHQKVKFTNDGNHPLTVFSLKTSCSCAIPIQIKLPVIIAPYQSLEFDVAISVAPTAVHAQSVTLDIQTDDSIRPFHRLTIRIDRVKSLVKAVPAKCAFGVIQTGTNDPIKVLLESDTLDICRIDHVTVSHPEIFSAKQVFVDTPGSITTQDTKRPIGELQVNCIARRAGTFSGLIEVSVGGNAARTIKIPVIATKSSELGKLPIALFLTKSVDHFELNHIVKLPDGSPYSLKYSGSSPELSVVLGPSQGTKELHLNIRTQSLHASQPFVITIEILEGERVIEIVDLPVVLGS